MFKRIRKSIQDAGRGNAPQNAPPSPQTVPERPKDEASGFICPMCMAGFSSPDQLQVHFDQVHAEALDSSQPTPATAPQNVIPSVSPEPPAVSSSENGAQPQPAENGVENNSSVAIANSESLHASTNLEPPRKETTPADIANADLKTIVNNRVGNDEGESMKIDYSELETTLKEEKWYSNELKSELDKKVSELEAQKTELDLMKQQMGMAITTNEELARDKEKVTEKLSKKSQQCAELQSQIDELKTEKLAHLESAKNQSIELEKAATWIRDLEAQLIERPGADDVLVLKKELVSVQQLMDQLTQDSEQQLEAAKTKCKELEEDKVALLKDMEDMKKKHEDDLQSQKSSEAILTESLQQRESQSSKLEEEGRKEKDRLKEELLNIQSSLENEQSHSHSLQIKNNELEEKYIEEREEKEKLLSDMNAIKTEVAKLKKDGEIQALELSSKEDELIKSKKKLDEILLEMDNSSSKTDVALQEKTAKIENLSQQYNDAIGERNALKKELEESVKSRNSYQEDLNKVREAHRQLELDKSLEIQKLQQMVDTLNGKVAEASSSDSELHEKIRTLEDDAKKSWNEIQEERSKSRILALEHENKISNLEGDKKRLESELHLNESRFQEELEKRQNLEAAVAMKESEIKSLTDDKASLVRSSEDLEKNLQEAKTRTDSIIKKKDDILADVKRLQQERSDLMEKMEVGEGQAILVAQLRDENDNLMKRLEERDAKAKDVAEEHTAKVKQLEASISDNLVAISHNENSLKSSETLVKKLESTVNSMKEENSNQKSQLEQKTEEIKNMSDLMSSQKIEFENKSSTLQRLLEEKTREYDKLSSAFDGFKTSSDTSLKMMENSRSSLQESLNTLREEKTRVEVEKKGLEEKLVLKETDLSNLNSSMNDMKKQQQGELEILKTRHNEKKAESDAQLRASQEQCTKIKVDLDAAHAKITEAEERLAENLKKVKLLEINLKDSERATASLQSDYEIANSKSNQLKDDMQKMKDDHLAELNQIKEENSKSVKALKLENDKAIENLKKDLDNLAEVHESEVINFKKLLEQSGETERSKAEDISKLQALLKEKEEALQTLQDRSVNDKKDLENKLQLSCVEVSELKEINQNLSDEKKDTEAGLNEKQLAFVGLEAKYSTLENDLADNATELKETRIQLETTIRSLKVAEEEAGSTTKKLSEVGALLVGSQEKNKNLEERVTALKNDIDSGNLEKTALEEKLTETQSKLEGAESTIQVKEEEVKTMKQLFVAKEKELLSTNEQLASEIEKCKTEIFDEKGKLEEEIFLRNQDKETWKNEKAEIVSELKAKELQWKAENDELLQSQDMLKGAQEILINSKMDLQKQLDSAHEEIEKVKGQLEETQESYQRLVSESKEREKNLASELEEEKKKLKTAEDEKQSVEARLQLEVSTLRENLDSVRGEWQQALQQVEDKNTESDEFRGQVMVLQATVQNNADERRALLERCITAEQSVEQFKQNESQLKRRLDNAQAAMHELGRENQAMQVKHSTVLSRQWADDREAIECSSCRKPFSITVRKHHCRHCGKIFCAECSAKTAAVAASKKPVRVCEKCYDDLLVVQ